MFDVRRLVVFREVARCGSLSAAAASLSYTTSAVSQQISALEREVGVAVLVRGPAGARPTEAGRRLLGHTETILAAIAAAEDDLARHGSAAPDVLRVASFASAAAPWSASRAARPGAATAISVASSSRSASFAISAYGKLTGRPAAALSIAGPGATNLLTGLWDANVDRAPALALTGQVDTQVLGPGAFQEIDLKAAFGGVALWSQTVLQTSRHPAALKDQVTTPAGCTIAGVLTMEDGRIRSVLARTIQEATRVASELGKDAAADR